MTPYVAHCLAIAGALTVSIGCQSGADPSGPAGPALAFQEQGAPPRNPYSVAAKDYVAQPLRGFDVRVVPGLLAGGEQAATGARALDALDRDLADVLDRLPKPAHAFLRTVPIFVGVADPASVCACYHVSPNWLSSHGFDPAKAKAVEIGSALTYLEWRLMQPSMVMHELSHAYHDQVLGKPHAGLREALERARSGGQFDRVVRFMGNVDSHYALTNTDEYFAETTEALFGVNDFYPFVRGELMAADPEGAALVAALWKAPPDPRLTQMTEATAQAREEIARLHRFFVDWFNGRVAESDESFAAFDAAMTPDFSMVVPSGRMLERAELVSMLRGAYGARSVEIETRLLGVKVLDGVRMLATYEEESTEGGTTKTLVSTVLFERDPGAPGGLRWAHVHETLKDTAK